MIRLILLTSLSLIAFAANSWLARAALIETVQNPVVNPAAFTLIRLISGAIFLIALIRFTRAKNPPKALEKQESWRAGTWTGAVMLLLYAAAFSFAYVRLDTGTGALTLFTTVQVTMLSITAVKVGLSKTEILGAITAFGGFVYLVGGGLGTPSLMGFILMILAGIGWGLYTLNGRGSRYPLAQTTGQFWRASLLAFPCFGIAAVQTPITTPLILLAIISGTLTSGAGYAIWYSALRDLPSTLAATVQLLVPVLAALMGWLFLNEALTARFLLSSLIILSGLAIVISAQKRRRSA